MPSSAAAAAATFDRGRMSHDNARKETHFNKAYPATFWDATKAREAGFECLRVKCRYFWESQTICYWCTLLPLVSAAAN